MTTSVRLEILVEPFKEDEPGPHVVTAVGAFENAGLAVDMGPFSSTVDGDLGAVLDALHDALSASFEGGADRIMVSLERG